jgi:hypothetical protein
MVRASEGVGPNREGRGALDPLPDGMVQDVKPS